MTEMKSKKPLKKKLTVAVTVIASMALVAIFLTAVLRSDSPTTATTSPEEMQAAIKELVAQGYKGDGVLPPDVGLL